MLVRVRTKIGRKRVICSCVSGINVDIYQRVFFLFTMALCIKRNYYLFSLAMIQLIVLKTISAEYYAYDVLNDGVVGPVFHNTHRIELRAISAKTAAAIPTMTTTTRPARILSEHATTTDPEDDYSDVGLTLPPDSQKPTHNHHYYYNSTFYVEPEKWKEYWVNLDSKNEQTIQVVLSNAYRKGITINLSFDFPFYGHLLRNITVTTGDNTRYTIFPENVIRLKESITFDFIGFVFTGEQVHSWLAATQYIAPLMANFDPSLTNDSLVKYVDNGTAFTVQWENVQLKDEKYAGNFTFQVTLLKSGDIIFVYREIPVSVMLISDDEHPVKVGLSDAYIIDRSIVFLRRKTIYEYHRVDLRKPDISNSTSIYFKALPTCVSITDCDGCMNANIGFDCAWCTGRCSDGMDRRRQTWITEGCSEQPKDIACSTEEESHSTREDAHVWKSEDGGLEGNYFETTPIALTSPPYLFTDTVQPVQMTLSTAHNVSTSASLPHTRGSDHYHQEKVEFYGLSTAGVVIIVLVVAMIFAFVGWVFYAYKNPQTPSGQLIIKYRPTQWSWPKGEARYTAASIHM